MALSDYYSINDLNKNNDEEEYNSFFNYMIGKNEVQKINEQKLFKKEKELNFQNFIGDERERTIPRKKEIENLFQNSERVSAIKSSVDFLEDERSRFSATTKKQDHRITDPLRVNRGLGLSHNDNTQTGIHPMYRAEQKSVDELRSKSNQKKKVVENAPITSGKKESRFLNSITKESLTRTPIKLLEKATQLIKGKSYIYAQTPKKNISIRKEEKSKEIIGNVNKNTSGIVIPGIFEPPKSTRKLDQDIGKSTFINNNKSFTLNDKSAVELKANQSSTYKQDTFKNIQGQNNAYQSNYSEKPKYKQSNFYEEKSFKNVQTQNNAYQNNFTEIPEFTQKNTLPNYNNNNVVGNNLGFFNQIEEAPELTQQNTLSNYNNNNVVGSNLGYFNNTIETPELSGKNTLSNHSSNNVSGNNFGFVNNTVEIPETTMKEVNTKENHVKNILPIFKNLYNKVTETPETTERETYQEKEKGNIFKNNETYNKFLETPETTLREINSKNTNIQQINDPTGLGYTSNKKEASTTIREMYSENKKQNSNIKNSNKSFTINTTNLTPTQRQFDSVNTNGNNGGIMSKNSRTKVFDKKGVCISDKRNMIETEVEKREPTKRNVNIIPSKKIIGDVELRPENKSQMYLKKYNPVKNHTDFC